MIVQRTIEEILVKYQELLDTMNTNNNEATWEDVASLVSKHFSGEECFLLGMQTGLQIHIQTISVQPDKTIN